MANKFTIGAFDCLDGYMILESLDDESDIIKMMETCTINEHVMYTTRIVRSLSQEPYVTNVVSLPDVELAAIAMLGVYTDLWELHHELYARQECDCPLTRSELLTHLIRVTSQRWFSRENH